MDPQALKFYKYDVELGLIPAWPTIDWQSVIYSLLKAPLSQFGPMSTQLNEQKTVI